MTSVVFAYNGMTGLPSLTRAIGSLKALLDAVLVDGWNPRTGSQISVSGGIATLTTTDAHGFDPIGQVVLLSNCPITSLNGRQRVISQTTNTISFAATGVADQVQTATMNVRAAPAGWERVFSAATKSVYRSPNVQGTRMYYRIDDGLQNWSTMSAAELFTDVDTAFDTWYNPTYWCKSELAADTAKNFNIFADDRTVFFDSQTAINQTLYGFGDINSARVNDPFACYLTGYPVAALSSASDVNSHTSLASSMVNGFNTSRRIMPRAANGVNRSVTMYQRFQSMPWHSSGYSDMFGGGQSFVSTTGVSAASIAYPCPATGGIVLAGADVIEGTTLAYRGSMRGIYTSGQFLAAVFQTNNVVDGTGHLEGRKLMCLGVNAQLNANNSANTGATARYFFDITGPW